MLRAVTRYFVCFDEEDEDYFHENQIDLGGVMKRFLPYFAGRFLRLWDGFVRFCQRVDEFCLKLETPSVPPPLVNDYWYRQAGPTSWIAYNGRQMIWEDASESLLLGKLKLMGYPEPQRTDLRVVKIT
jgi:hypothetical protein